LKAYRRLAMKWHPDKNYQRIQVLKMKLKQCLSRLQMLMAFLVM
jgi:DnaJ-class molecular chaperone